MGRKRIAFIGCGNMAEALISGLVKSDYTPQDIAASDILPTRLEHIKKLYHINIFTDNVSAVKFADVVVLSIKPQHAREVLKQINTELKDKLIVSIMAGLTTRYIESFLQMPVDVIRCMPNTPALIGQGMICLCKGSSASEKDAEYVSGMFGSSGEVLVIEEDMMDAVTAVSGSGPAYVFYLTEMLASAAVEMGISRDKALALAVQTVYGSGNLMKISGESPGSLRGKVTSPGGTTEAALNLLKENKFSDIFKRAVKAACARSGEISRKKDET